MPTSKLWFWKPFVYHIKKIQKFRSILGPLNRRKEEIHPMRTIAKQYSTKDIERLKQDILKSIKKTEDDLFQNQNLKWRIDFFISSIFPYSRYKTLEEILLWLEDFRKNNKNSVDLIGIKELQKWYVEEHTGNIRHESGKFFS